MNAEHNKYKTAFIAVLSLIRLADLRLLPPNELKVVVDVLQTLSKEGEWNKPSKTD
jgi:hypothetical protein